MGFRCSGRDVRGERRLPHRRPAGEDEQIGVVQAAQQAIQASQASGHTAQFPSPLVRRLRTLDRAHEAAAECCEAAIGVALRQLVQPLLDTPDLFGGGLVRVRRAGLAHGLARDADDASTQRGVTNNPGC